MGTSMSAGKPVPGWEGLPQFLPRGPVLALHSGQGGGRALLLGCGAIGRDPGKTERRNDGFAADRPSCFLEGVLCVFYLHSPPPAFSCCRGFSLQGETGEWQAEEAPSFPSAQGLGALGGGLFWTSPLLEKRRGLHTLRGAPPQKKPVQADGDSLEQVQP